MHDAQHERATVACEFAGDDGDRGLSSIPVERRAAGESLPGLGSGDTPELDRAANPGCGQHVYAESCAAYHNADGSGFPRIWLSANPGYMVPPLWRPTTVPA